MIYLKSQEDIQNLFLANDLVSKTLALVGKNVKEGVTTKQLDSIAEEFIRDNGAVPAFLGYGGFPATLCTSVNESIVHGIPSDKCVLKPGDIISVDCGAFINSFCGDSAYTFAVEEIDQQKQSLLDVTKEALYRGIQAAKIENRIGDISYAVQQYAESHNMGVVRELVGHGIGKNMHEEPQVPNYGRRGTGPKIKDGLVICIEPMINLGTKNVKFHQDGWTITTADNKPSAHFELCIAITKEGVRQLSTFEYIENNKLF